MQERAEQDQFCECITRASGRVAARPTPLHRAKRLLNAQSLEEAEHILVDQVADDTGVGFFAPFAHLALGLDHRGWRAGVDGRVTRRWQFGADDHTQWQAALVVGYTLESKLDQPIR